eukprot:2157583-Rhodomonas_salina.2
MSCWVGHRTALTAFALHAVCRTRNGARGHERRCVLEHAHSVSWRAYYDACGCCCSICRCGLPRSARAPNPPYKPPARARTLPRAASAACTRRSGVLGYLPAPAYASTL